MESTKNTKNRKKLFLIIVLILLLLLLILGFFFLKSHKNNDVKKGGITYQTEETTTTKNERKNIIFPGYTTSTKTYKISENKTLELMNPDINDVNFVYTITENGKEIFVSENIKPGNSYQWEICQYFEKGPHEININITPYSIEDNTIKNGINEIFKFIITE